MATIATVHGALMLPEIPLSVGRLRPSPTTGRVRRGEFVFDQNGNPIKIVIEANESHLAFTTIHEVGHFLDLSGIGPAGRFESTVADGELASWRTAVFDSEAVGQLADMATSSDSDVDQLLIRDLLEISELWARSYVQYVVTFSARSGVQASLDWFRARTPGALYYPMHWDDDDFADIAVVIDQTFRRLGWRTF